MDHRLGFAITSSAFFSLIALGTHAQTPSKEKTCLHVASYEAELEWTAGVDKSLREKMAGGCKLETFFMETKKNPGDEFAKKKGLEARDLITKMKPDVVFLSDDNAIKWLLLPYFKESTIPFVFIGVNWSIEPYKLPFKHTTGVIEVAPIDAMVYEIKKALPQAKTIAFLTIDTETERKEFPHVAKRFQAAGYSVKEYWATSAADWRKLYLQAQNETDFVYLSNKLGAPDWKDEENSEFAKKNQKKLSGGTYVWLTPVATFVMAKSPTEQGEIASEQAKKVLSGQAPNSVPVTANKLYDAVVNTELLKKTGLKLSEGFMRRAKAL